jgi:hypothetical protein
VHICIFVCIFLKRTKKKKTPKIFEQVSSRDVGLWPSGAEEPSWGGCPWVVLSV